ncbi:MAG: ABC transporter substrate-binding protein [Natronospirillum sp.]|uniref:ABC transporter substrate-binding protein n=1 Tax=Natronospirillum sp. TaxID=2812955 RepID=UPI0025D115AF|nr:ABC transporter substrate-binding protein [Natronospirillum sp.]MCH8552421.1 ABC transporter substrate-binding protein [Natronospirillum sp.]
MKKTISAIATATALSAVMATSALASTLVINSNASDPAPREAWTEIVERFQEEYPDIRVVFNEYDHEGYKTVIRNWLVTNPPDVVMWFAGERMNFFVQRNLFEDVSDIWDQNNLHESMASSRAAMTIDDRQWGIPATYYQWGMYYNQDVFDELGLSEPTNWEELLEVGDTLVENGIAPFTIGTRFLWTTAGWFDYLNLRINGLDYHNALMAGEIPYTDDGVRDVFMHWKELVDRGFFIENHASYTWQEAQPFLYRGDAAMYLIGNFITPGFPDDVNMGFFQFPQINPQVGMYEDAPTDTLHIPARANNKEDARKFLEFAARPEQQAMLNATLNQLPTHRDAEVADDPFLQAGMQMLSASDGTAQFYDRDTVPDMYSVGMEAFQEFMVNPDRLDQILERLERTRARVFR